MPPIKAALDDRPEGAAGAEYLLSAGDMSPGAQTSSAPEPDLAPDIIQDAAFDL